MIDSGLLLLRAAGFLLAFTFGVQKIGWYVTAFHAAETVVIDRPGAADCTRGLPVTGHSGIVDHAK